MKIRRLSAAPVEWVHHKSRDGSRPSGVEQQYVWLMNRARCSPEVEGIWLSLLRESGVLSAIRSFGVNRKALRDEFGRLSPTPPAAFDIRLHDAAVQHSEYLIRIGGQNHDRQFERVTEAGFTFSQARGSVFSYSRNGLYGHAGFNIDWGGDDGTGMQTGRGHRAGLMGVFSNVGVGVVESNDPGGAVGPQVTTINYANAGTWALEHYNRFLVGTVWRDRNGNRLYDPGEGLRDVLVLPDHGAFYAITGQAGGYAFPVDSGSYVIQFGGGELKQTVTREVTVGNQSVWLPWLSFSPTVSDPNWIIHGSRPTFTASWTHYLGQASAVLIRDAQWTGEIADSDIKQSGFVLNWSVPWDSTINMRFFSIKGWSHNP